jgi:hypothetical protein
LSDAEKTTAVDVPRRDGLETKVAPNVRAAPNAKHALNEAHAPSVKVVLSEKHALSEKHVLNAKHVLNVKHALNAKHALSVRVVPIGATVDAIVVTATAGVETPVRSSPSRFD